MNRTALAWLAVTLLVLGGAGVVLAIKTMRQSQTLVGAGEPEVDLEYRQVPPSGSARWLTEFTLTERSGQQVGSAELAGKVHVVNFFFATCPTSCLQQNRKFAEVHQAYAGKGVQFVSITCDPENDTPQSLRDYASKNFPQAGSTWWFLTGDLTYIQRVAGEIFLVYLERQKHMEDFLVIDKWGNHRGKFHWSRDAEITDLRRLLDKLVVEKAPPDDLPPKPTPPAESDAKETGVQAAGEAPPAESAKDTTGG
ncbi:MAG: SCO family protein [Pirellulaceae bacterium]